MNLDIPIGHFDRKFRAKLIVQISEQPILLCRKQAKVIHSHSSLVFLITGNELLMPICQFPSFT